MKNKKLIILLFLCTFLFLNCKREVKQKEYNFSNNKERQLKSILNQDSIYNQEINSIMYLKETNIHKKREMVLLNIVSRYINKNKEVLKESDFISCERPAYVIVQEERSYNGNNVYSIFLYNNSVYDIPTKLDTINNRYVLIYYSDKKSISKEQVPIILTNKCENEIYTNYELSWIVIFCKNSIKHLVIMDVFGIEDCYDYFKNFSCKG
jgi:hypothetical protein